ncbi:MAG: hypothetical protein JKP95_00750 [Oceanicaulis sp.]|nr:hypothetical protein [Oceanicaulis sp.]
MIAAPDRAQPLDWIEPVQALKAFEAEPYTLLLQGGGAQPWGAKAICAPILTSSFKMTTRPEDLTVSRRAIVL